MGLWLLLVVVAVEMSAVVPKQQIKADDTWIGQSDTASELIRLAPPAVKPPR